MGRIGPEMALDLESVSSERELEPRVQDLRDRVVRAVARSLEGASSPVLLLSGGLDTSIVAHVGAPLGLRRAVTVVVGEAAPDEPFASEVARRCGLEQRVVRLRPEDLLAEVPFVVRATRSFDPMEVRNSVVVARGLAEAARMGGSSALTGDAADELFGGYSYLWSKPEVEFTRASSHLREVMRFSSFPMGEALGLSVHAPFLDPPVVELSSRLTKNEKVRALGGTTHGKYLLRVAFPEVENRWRRKDPIEVGSGSAVLPTFFLERSNPLEFEHEGEQVRQTDGVEIRDPEHLAYYRVFREVFGGSPPLPRTGRDPCRGCGFDLPGPSSNFCVTCGAWPARAPG